MPLVVATLLILVFQTFLPLASPILALRHLYNLAVVILLVGLVAMPQVFLAVLTRMAFPAYGENSISDLSLLSAYYLLVILYRR
jgi:hypothetical protein